MKHAHRFTAGLAILFASALTAAAADEGGASPAAGANRFAGRLYGELAAGAEGNLVVSPYSIHSAMAMVAAGAAGNTESQMAAALNLPGAAEDRSAAIQSILKRITAVGAAGDVTLEAAHRVWVQESYPLLPAFTGSVERTFGAGFATADFTRQAEPARRRINAWVEEKTRNRIRDLLPAGILTPLTRMVLVNAVYFYGTWAVPFSEAQTRPEPFFAAPDQPRDTPMMNAKLERVGYREEAGLQICELPYKGGALSMVVLLPEAGGLPALEARMAREGFDAVCGRLIPQTVQTALPKFKIEAQFGLNDPLIRLGMRDAFDAQLADFSGMTGTRDLFVSAVVHKAFIEVNEKGTEAAAATGVIMATRSMPIEKRIVFRANRPFLFALRDRESGLVLFIGRVADPKP